MKFIFIFCLLVGCLGAEPIRFATTTVQRHDFDILDGEVYTLITHHPDRLEDYGRSLIYVSNETEKIIRIDELSAFYEIAKLHIDSLEEELSPGILGRELTKMVWPMVEHNMIVLSSPEQTRAVSAMLKANIPNKNYNLVSAQLAPGKYSCDGERWSLEYVMITPHGALERLTLKGMKSPFVISSRMNELLAPQGTIPDFGYGNGMEDQYRENFEKTE